MVLATFGRGFYVMDDYSALRDLSEETLEREAHLFPVAEALQYEPYSPIAASNSISWLGPKGFQGETYYLGENPPFGAAFTYYLKDSYATLKSEREKGEAEQRKEGEVVYYPSYDQLKAEKEEEKPFLIFTIKDVNGEVVNELRKSPQKGINRVYWDLKYPAIDELRTRYADPSSSISSSGIMVLPGTYTVELAKSIQGEITPLVEPVAFEVKSLGNRSLPPTDPAAMLAFHRELMQLSKSAHAVTESYRQLSERLKYYQAASRMMDNAALDEQLDALEGKLESISLALYGDALKSRLEIDQSPSLTNRVNTAIYSGNSSFSDPTQTAKMVKQIAEERLAPVIASLKEILGTDIPAIDQMLNQAQAPWTPGRILELDP
ncbi:MAG: hypothetical protein AAF804_05055 [Bacteroidota bacterium]